MERTSYPVIGTALLGLLFVPLLGSAARGDEPKLSIGGYDPVAYFTDGRPVQGKADLEYLWHQSRWRFASSEHRDLFSKDPGHYAPQYDGYCAMGASDDAAPHKDTVDPNAWAVVDGKLYLLHNSYWLAQWRNTPTSTSSGPTRVGRPSRISQPRSSSDPHVPRPHPPPRSPFATAGIG
jgi:hypothetical protein